MGKGLFTSQLWRPALDKYTEATGLSVELFDLSGERVLSSEHPTPLAALFREFGCEPGLFAECARRCVSQSADRPAVVTAEAHGLAVVGTSLVLEGSVVGAAVAGFALARFQQVAAVQRLARTMGVPFDRLWDLVRRLPPAPERRLKLNGELLQVLGDALLRENHRTRQYEDTATQLVDANAAKDQFLAVLSHELRTPLTAIAGWAGVMKKSSDLAHVHRASEAIERNALLQSRMVDELLDMSRITRGTISLDLEILELTACVGAALETMGQAIEEKSIHVDFEEPSEPLHVEGDAARLQQVFRNLLGNAAKFTPAGGSIRITLARQADQAVLTVADTGKGIAPEFLASAFDIFRQEEQSTRRGNEGMGIGLSLVKKLTELHNGSARIHSEGVGQGTEVTVRLPLVATPPRPDNPTDALAGLAVLVVEDSEDARESLRVLLELRGANVSIARDGREALDAMRREAGPDVILCDLLMPRMDGFEFIRELDSRRLPHPPVLAVSGLTSDASRERTQQVGFEGHIKKPYDEAAVIGAVTKALERRRALPAPSSAADFRAL